MTFDRKRLLRAAVAIQRLIAPRQPWSNCHVTLHTGTWQNCLVLQRKLSRAGRRGWRHAATRLQSNLQAALQRLAGELSSTMILLEEPERDSRPASASEILADLRALEDEFGAVTFDKRANTLSVTTESIELEGVDLGEFEIRLDWDDVTPCYRVVALTPNPAATNEAITHPHVDEECLCEGDARTPIRHALEAGRLFDFFLIVASVLRTYNAGSPYVALDDWEGLTCADCGDTANSDEQWTCRNCSTIVCGGCYTICDTCEETCCSECNTCCDGCVEAHCLRCMKSSPHTNQSLCPACLAKHERLAKQNAQNSERIGAEGIGTEESEETEIAHAAVQSFCLVEASVSS